MVYLLPFLFHFVCFLFCLFGFGLLVLVCGLGLNQNLSHARNLLYRISKMRQALIELPSTGLQLTHVLFVGLEILNFLLQHPQ